MDDFEVSTHKSKRAHVSRSIIISLLCIIALMTVIIVFRGSSGKTHSSGLLSQAPFAVDDKTTLSDLYENVADSVVSIVRTSTSSILGQESNNIGSGFIVTYEGHIVTNYHVVSDASKIEVKLNNRHSYQATLIGYDQSLDIAVIKIKPNEKLTVSYIGNSNTARPGDWVFAIGTPHSSELYGTITRGIVSFSGRRIENSNATFLQIDAAINPGNSGGPLFNMAGEVIGINTSKITTAENIGFSICSDTFKSVVEDMINRSPSIRLGIGVSGYSVSESKYSEILPDGFIIEAVTEGGPADAAGIKPYDIIIKFDGISVKSIDEIRDVLNKHEEGDVVSIVVIRNSIDNEVTLSLKKLEFYD